MIYSVMRQMYKPIYARRVRVIADGIEPHLEPDDRVLDVGCGSGALGGLLRMRADVSKRIDVHGLETRARGEEPIQVTEYHGGPFPFEDNTFDVVIVADVLHHDADQLAVLRECKRVSRRLVVIKDHKRTGPVAQGRISLIDLAANAPFGVKCLYKYHTLEQWRELIHDLGFKYITEQTSMRLYPPVANFLFGRRLQYFAVLDARFA